MRRALHGNTAGLDAQGRWFVVRAGVRYVWCDLRDAWITEVTP